MTLRLDLLIVEVNTTMNPLVNYLIAAVVLNECDKETNRVGVLLVQ
jgi:hypothetical protein